MDYESHIILTDLSDHFPCLLLKTELNIEGSRTITKRKLTNSNIEKIRRDLETKNLEVATDTVDNEFSKLHRKILDSLDRFAPE